MQNVCVWNMLKVTIYMFGLYIPLNRYRRRKRTQCRWCFLSLCAISVDFLERRRELDFELEYYLISKIRGCIQTFAPRITNQQLPHTNRAASIHTYPEYGKHTCWSSASEQHHTESDAWEIPCRKTPPIYIVHTYPATDNDWFIDKKAYNGLLCEKT